MTTRETVAFVCLHGAAKSVIAARFFDRLAEARGLGVRAVALGTEPSAAIPGAVVSALLADGIDARGVAPLPATADALAGAARIVSFGCDLGAVAPGRTVERWDDVPAVSEDYTAARDAIVGHLHAWLPGVAATAR